MRNKMKYDVAVIGGGVCGTAIAYYLAKAGVRVALLEKKGICSGTSGTNLGFCVLTYREDPLLMRLALEQNRSLPHLSQELDMDIEYFCTGGLIPFSNQEELGILEKLVENCHQWGLKEVEIVKPERAVQQEPALDPSKIMGAVYCPLEGRLNPFNLTIGFARKARERGADIFTETAVTGFEICNGEVERILTSRGTIEASLVIVAAGAWTREVLNLAGTDLPVYYERGEAMVSMPVPQTVRGMVTDGGLFVKGPETNKMVVGSCLAQTFSGNIVIAQATTDVDKYNCSSTYEGPCEVARRTLSFFPGLADLEIIRMWGGMVAYTSDRIPIFGYLQNPGNVFAVVGFHSAIGIAPAIGRMVQEIYLKGTTGYDITKYLPQRFLEQTRKDDEEDK